MTRIPHQLALLLFTLLLCACRGLGTGDGALIVASDLDNAPFAWVDEDDRPRGRDVEMMELLAADLGRTLTWQRMPFDELLDACEAGHVDVVCATLGITEGRAQRVDFSQPYFETAIAVVVRRGDDEPGRLADLRGRRVAAGAGTTSQLAVENHLRGSIGVFEAKAGQTTAQRLASRDVDAAVMDGPAAAAMAQTSGGTLRVLDEVVTTERYALCVPKGREELVRDLDRGLQRLRREGALANLNARHGL